MRPYQSLEFFLSRRIVSVGVLTLVLLNKFFTCAWFNNISGDKSLYTLLAKNVLNGHGYTETFNLLSQSGTYYFSHHSGITPGYSILVLIPMWLTGQDSLLSTLIADCISWVVLIFSIRAVLKLCAVPTYLINIALLFIGFFIYPAQVFSAPKEPISVGLLFWAVYFLIKTTRSSSTSPDHIWFGIFSFLPGIVKNTFLPITLVFIIVHAFIAFRLNKKPGWKRFGWSTVTTCLLALLFYLWLAWVNKSPGADLLMIVTHSRVITNHPEAFMAGFTPGNILFMYPFIPAALTNVQVVSSVIGHATGATYYYVFSLARVVNFILLPGLLILLVRFGRKFTPVSSRHVLVLAGAAISASVLGILIYMSSRYGGSILLNNDRRWTYVSDERVYFFMVLFLQCLFFIYCFPPRSRRIPAFSRFIRNLIFFLLLLQAMHGVYFSMSRSILYSKGTRSEQSREAAVWQVVDEVIRSHPGKKIEIVSALEHIRWMGLLRDQKVFADVLYLNDPKAAKLDSAKMRIIIVNPKEYELLLPFRESQNTQQHQIQRGYYHIFLQQ